MFFNLKLWYNFLNKISDKEIFFNKIFCKGRYFNKMFNIERSLVR